MGKKNKKQSTENGNKKVETTQPKGGSVIIKGPKDQQKAVNQQKNAKKPPQSPQIHNKKPNLSKKVDENKLKDAVTNIAGKKKKKRNKKNKSATPTDSPIVTPAKKDPVAITTEGSENENGSAVTLTKRVKNRCKSKIKKEIILKGKSKLGLADPKLVARKLAKLKNKAEPHSKAAQRNILMLEKLLARLLSAEKKQHKKGSLDSSTASAKAESDESLVDSDEDMEDDSEEEDEATDKIKPAKKEKKATKAAAPKQNGKAADAKDKRPPKDDKFFLFVGNLPKEITEDVIKEHFKNAGTLQKVKIPVPRRNKTKRFAYVQFADEPSRQKALELHGSIIEDKKITVLFADKSKGRSGLMSKNAKLNAVRKQSAPGTEKAVAKPKKNKKKKQKPKKSA